MGESCSGSVYTRFDTWHDLIVQTVTTAASLGGYPLPSWTAPAPPSADDAGTDAAPDADDAGCEADGAPCTGAQRSSSGGCAASPAEPGRGAWLFGLGLGVEETPERRQRVGARHRVRLRPDLLEANSRRGRRTCWRAWGPICFQRTM